jgi:hypothetical protein
VESVWVGCLVTLIFSVEIEGLLCVVLYVCVQALHASITLPWALLTKHTHTHTHVRDFLFWIQNVLNCFCKL